MNNSKDSAFDIQIDVQNQEGQTLQDKNSDKNINQISQIEKFLQCHYRDVNNLQSYLINELQAIEDCKNRNKKVHKMIVSNIIPTFRDIKNQIINLKSIIPLLNSLATTYIQAVYQKSAFILDQKQTQCRRYKVEIEDLKRKVQLLKQRQTKMINISASVQNIPIKVQKLQQTLPYFKTAQRFYSQDLLSPLQQSFSKMDKQTISTPKNRTENQEISVFRGSFNEEVYKHRTDLKLNKYEEVYQNILKNKKINISYKCEKSPIKMGHESRSASKSPCPKSALSTNRPEESAEDHRQYDRKQYIKQKIEKIKLKSQCKQKQYQRNVVQKQRIR